MNLKNATLLTIFGIAYFFALRFVGTIYPAAFRSLTAAQIISILSLLAGLVMVFFYIQFYKDYAREEQQVLKKAAVWAIIGSGALLIVHVKEILLVFSPHMFPFLRTAHYIDMVIPWVSSILILLFFIILYKEVAHEEKILLRKAALSAVIGSSVQTVLLALIFFNYFLSNKVMVTLRSTTLWIIFVPIIVFSFAAIFYFFYTFYRIQKHIE